MSSDLLDKATIRLIQDARFYAEMLMLSTKVVDPNLTTIGVSVPDNVTFHFNPHFWNSLSLAEQVDVLIHECDHVLKGHLTRYKDLEPTIFEEKEDENLLDRIEKMQEFHALNIAGDYENNEYLKNLPKKINYFNPDGTKVLNPETGLPVEGSLFFVKDLIAEDPKVLAKQNLEYYYHYLKQKQNQGGGGEGKDGKGKTTIDDHSLWQKGGKNSEYVKEKVRQLVNRALENAVAAGAQPSNEIMQHIHNLNNKTKDWRQDLQRFTAKLIEVTRTPTRKVRNRRYALLYPGYRSDVRLTLAIGLDISGSVYDEMLGQFMAEIAKISKHNVKIYVIQCDTDVRSVEEFDEKKPIIIKSRGGTNFLPVFQAAEELEVDGLIYLTDGENYDTDQVTKPKFSTMWALPEGCKVSYNWGMKTVIKINKNAK